ncbi:MAG: universal stress protein [Marinoscillum sp.]|uniref:universal stress protein n=1 Tax=Marinoscillum sp. TaxID=2024838 RepID=UPI0032FBE425
MKKILVPTDFSECAKNATALAKEIARRYHGELHFYHFVSVPVDWVHLDFAQHTIYPDVTQEVNRVKKLLDAAVKDAEADGLKSIGYMDFDNSTDAVTRYARSNDISMIVMGSHGARGVKEFFIGSNAQTVVRHAEVPVLVVKHKFKRATFPTILFVSDFEAEMMRPFEDVVDFAELLGAKIHLLFVNTPSEFQRSWVIKERMEGFIALASDNLEKVEIVDSHTFGEGVEKYCEINQTGLLAIATHHRKGLSRAFLGSLTETVVNHVKVPVVSFPILT